MSLIRPFAAALLACGLLSTHGAGAESRQALASAAANDAAPLSPAARGELTRAFVLKWGGYVQRIYGVSPDVWAKRMVATFVAADPTNFRIALKRETFEGAISQLNGTGHRLIDAQVIDRFAGASSARGLTSKALALDGTKTLGSTTSDLVFTPVTPCRIVDTRVAGGPVGSNSARDFVAISPSGNYTSQGGSATNCGISTASAVVINITSVLPSAPGYATVYPYGNVPPQAASLNYTTGAIVNNTVISSIPNPLTAKDFSIYTYAQSDFVVDIVGYFAAPQATALQCIQSGYFNQAAVQPNSLGVVTGTACPNGYTRVTTSCNVSSNTVSLTVVAIGGCQAYNFGPAAETISAESTCCRVPGR